MIFAFPHLAVNASIQNDPVGRFHFHMEVRLSLALLQVITLMVTSDVQVVYNAINIDRNFIDLDAAIDYELDFELIVFERGDAVDIDVWL